MSSAGGEWTPSQLRELFEQRFRDQEKALDLQAKEYERRLEALNHEHARAVEVQHTYLTQEKFEDFVVRYEENREIIAKALTLAEGKESGSSQAWQTLIVVLTIFIAAGSVVAVILSH